MSSCWSTWLRWKKNWKSSGPEPATSWEMSKWALRRTSGHWSVNWLLSRRAGNRPKFRLKLKSKNRLLFSSRTSENHNRRSPDCSTRPVLSWKHEAKTFLMRSVRLKSCVQVRRALWWQLSSKLVEGCKWWPRTKENVGTSMKGLYWDYWTGLWTKGKGLWGEFVDGWHILILLV